MNLVTHRRDSPIVAYPRSTLYLIFIASVCGLAFVLVIVSQTVGNSTDFYVTKDIEDVGTITPPGLVNSSFDVMQPGLDGSFLSPSPRIQSGSADSGCDLYHGKWVYDSSGPLYTNDSCPVLTPAQNCRRNGRPDKDYENWRWKPAAKCHLPGFDAKKFLELMRGKTLAFIGDSLARNQMQSLVCILWQVEVPKKLGAKRFYFRSTSTMIFRIMSQWPLHQTSKPFDTVPEGVVKVYLDAQDEGIMGLIPSFDVIVLTFVAMARRKVSPYGYKSKQRQGFWNIRRDDSPCPGYASELHGSDHCAHIFARSLLGWGME